MQIFLTLSRDLPCEKKRQEKPGSPTSISTVAVEEDLHETTEEELVPPKACTFSMVEEQEPARRGREGSTSQDNRQTAKGGRKARE
jgi:hypothetical protein